MFGVNPKERTSRKGTFSEWAGAWLPDRGVRDVTGKNSQPGSQAGGGARGGQRGEAAGAGVPVCREQSLADGVLLRWRRD